MSKIALLTEQTIFLVEQEKSAFAEINKKMNDFLLLLQDKASKYQDEESKKTLLAIEKNIKEQQAEMAGGMKEDILFLEKQLATMQEISTVEDSVRREELTKMILSEVGELLSMDTFKKQIEEQSEEAQKEFISMIDDMESSINEGKEEELLMLMEHADDEISAESCCDNEECDDECSDDEYDAPISQKTVSEEDELEECEENSCDDDSCDDDFQEGLTNDLEKDLSRAEALKTKKCCRSDQGCSGQCRCKNQCSSNA